jgi:RHS repeat-associated protein
VSDGKFYKKIDYQYNIRGWLKSINDTDCLNCNIGNFQDLFSFKIHYNTVTKKNIDTNVIEEVNNSYNNTVKKLYNGNIAETYWRTASDATLRKYSYAYDDLNRLNDAYYQKPESNIEAQNSYNESLTYDKNGNITTLIRKGNEDGDLFAYEIDNLGYKYQDRSNILTKVIDATNESLGFKDDSDGTNDNEDDYKYDAYGNMISDQNKNITKIVYNHLNLPTVIEFLNSEKIIYFYNAAGVKLRKEVHEYFSTNGTRTTDYLGGFQYLNNVLQFFPHPEGYVKNTPREDGSPSYDYVYNYTDHLGNIRLSYTLDPYTIDLKILEENHYYPFGLKHTNYSTGKKTILKETQEDPKKVGPSADDLYKYKYNGKEWQDELGLNFYDYGARNYDAAIGRFMNLDRFAEKYYNLNPYQYGANNPVIFNDIKGDSIMIYSKQDKGYVKYDNGNLYSRNADTGKWEAYNGKNVKTDKNGNKSIGGFLGKATAALNRIRTGGVSGNELVSTIENDSKWIRIKEGKNDSTGIAGGVTWNNSNSDAAGNSRPSYIGLAHELGHALDGLDGMMNDNSIGVIGGKDIPANELTAMHWENKVRAENGIQLRQNYGMGDNGQPVGQNINKFGQSMFFNNQSVLPSVSLQAEFSSSGINLKPIQTGNTIIMVPYQY